MRQARYTWRQDSMNGKDLAIDLRILNCLINATRRALFV
jgi:hypothetical protein